MENENAAGAVRASGGASEVYLGRCTEQHTTYPSQSQRLVAELSGDNTCNAAGVTARGYAPELILCRQLLAAGVDPDTALDVYRGTTLALRIRSIGEGAKLTVEDNHLGSPVFRRLRNRPKSDGTAPPVRRNGRLASC